jgi:hypothetical protein
VGAPEHTFPTARITDRTVGVRRVAPHGVRRFWLRAHLFSAMNTTTLLLAVLVAVPAFAQQLPIQVDVYTYDNKAPGQQWAELIGNMGNAGAQQVAASLQAGIAAGLRQQELDLARQRFEWEKEQAKQSARLQDRVLDQNLGYREAKPQVAEWRINQDVLDAFKAARKAHPDFDQLQPVMRVVADAVRPDWRHVTMPQYIEALYAIAKTTNFGEPARREIPDTQAH